MVFYRLEDEMIVADISEMKDRIGNLVAAVQSGDEVVITDRGRSVARIVKEPRAPDSGTARLTGLAVAGLVTLPREVLSPEETAPPRIEGPPLSDIVCEDRR